MRNIPGLLTRDLSTLRIDHDFSPRDKFFAVYNYQIVAGEQRALAVSPLPAFGLRSQHQNNHTLSLSYTRLVSNSLVNELRGGFNFQYLFRRANQRVGSFLSSIGFNQDEISAYAAVVGGDEILNLAGQVAFTMAPFTGIPNGGRSIDRRERCARHGCPYHVCAKCNVAAVPGGSEWDRRGGPARSNVDAGQRSVTLVECPDSSGSISQEPRLWASRNPCW